MWERGNLKIFAKIMHMVMITGLALCLVGVVNATAINTSVNGHINTDTTWTKAHSPYIVTDNILVQPGITLTIEKGVVVKFDSDRMIQIDGELIAIGTESERITFTSNQLSPTAGNWKGIKFTDTSIDASYDKEENYLSGSIMQYCTVEYGGNAIAMGSSSPLINHCIIRQNAGSGINASSNHIEITDNTIAENLGGGIRISGNFVILRNNTLTNNSVRNDTWDAHSYGGGIFINGEVATITGNVITNNVIDAIGQSWSSGYAYGGGIYINGKLATISDNTIADNSLSIGRYHGSAYGGGIYIRGKSARVGYNTVTGNSISGEKGNEAYGGGIYIKGDLATINSNIIVDNSAITEPSDGAVIAHGGGIYLDGDYGTIIVNNISDNSISATYNGSSAWYDACAYGGGFYIIGNFATINSNTITSNSISANSDGMYDNCAYAYGGGFYINGNSITITNNSVIDNSVTACGETSSCSWKRVPRECSYAYGGGIYSNSYGVTISDSIIAKNTASPGSGGGIYINGKLATICYNNIDENSAKYGGGIHASGNTVIITNNSISNNSAEGDGAGIYTDGCKAIRYNLIRCNSISGDDGKAGGIYVTEQPSINYNNIYDNAPYDIYNSNACNSSAVNATNNWWGSTDEARIQAHIYDWYDNSSLGIVNNIPYLISKSSNVKRYNKGFVGNASPVIWYVDDGGGADFTEIKEAITAASDGDTIIVKDGNYIENVNVTKSLTIKSENGPDSTRVRSRVQSEPIFNVIADCVEISGFMMEYASDGVHLECVDYSDISNNKFYQCTNGIALYDSDNNCISNNNCSNVLERGIYLSNSNYNSISNNTCPNNDYGIYLTDQSNHNGISNNTCSNTFWTSISINGNNNRVFNNCFNNSRTAIDLGGSSNSITNNTCFNNEGDGIYIGTNSNNNNISYNICSNNSYGININGKKSKGSFGYYTISSSNNSISYNNCCSNRVGGICLSYSTHNRIFCNNNSNIGHISYSKWICGDGINIIGSDYTSISNNTCSNTDKGITLSGSDTGISNNTCSNNDYGIYIYSGCRRFSICYNNFLNNRRIGIFVGDGSGDDRFIYLNNFINNTENVESCDESATFNTPVKIIYTHNGKQYANYLGNYWDDYKGKDVDVDGIGNTPYHIENGKDDIYPLMEPWENYF